MHLKEVTSFLSEHQTPAERNAGSDYFGGSYIFIVPSVGFQLINYNFIEGKQTNIQMNERR